MPTFTVSYELVDFYKRKGTKRYETTATMTDFAAAQAAAAALATDLANITEMEILAYSVGERTVYSDSVISGANKDEGVTFTMRKLDNQNAALKVPAPINAIFNEDGTVDLLDAAVTAYVANFMSGADFTFSDGEQASQLVSGRLDK